MPEQAPERPIRTCVPCGKSDDHPKHGIALDPWTTVWHHFDCGARMDPPCGTTDPDMRLCASEIEGWDGTPGDGMRAHLTRDRSNEQHTEKAGA